MRKNLKVNIKDFQIKKIPYTHRKRGYTVSLEEWHRRFKEIEWIGEFLSHCEKNGIEKNITYIVPKNCNSCPCRRFKALYNKYFKKIECSECDLGFQPTWKTYSINLSELKECVQNVHEKPV